jgi:hypothetical protein
MSTPKIDVAALPGLESAQGVFGSISQASAPYSDGVVDVMVYVYNVMPPEGGA